MEYQVIISDWDGPDWSEDKWVAFTTAMNKGEINPDQVDFILTDEDVTEPE